MSDEPTATLTFQCEARSGDRVRETLRNMVGVAGKMTSHHGYDGNVHVTCVVRWRTAVGQMQQSGGNPRCEGENLFRVQWNSNFEQMMDDAGVPRDAVVL